MKRDLLENLQLPEGFRLLIRRLRRGASIFQSLFLIFAVCAGGALFFRGGVPWAIAGFMVSLAAKLMVLLHVERRYVSACRVAENPQIVYWAHATDRHHRAVAKLATEARHIKLHLKDGSQLVVDAVIGTGTSPTQLREIVSWLRHQNPSIRWGDYDQTNSIPGDPV